MKVHDHSLYFSDQQVGKKQGLTPEGFLICHDVPVARTGEQIYGPEETPIEPGADGLVHILRDAKEVFRPETISSFEGKDIVDEHPQDGAITPDNWRDLTVGHAQNIHRGTGVEDDYLFADFIIKDPEAIQAIQAGKRQVSCGYDADYRKLGPGRGEQYNIRGNHIALVDQGRCGPRCAIRDHHPSQEELRTMSLKKKLTFRDKMMKLLGAKDAAEFEEMLEQPAPEDAAAEETPKPGDSHVHVHLDGAGGEMKSAPNGEKVADDGEPVSRDEFEAHKKDNMERFDRLEAMLAEVLEATGGTAGDAGETEEEKAAKAAAAGTDAKLENELEEEAPAGTGDKARKATDSAYLADSFQETAALAEILVPGIKLPTFDVKAKPKDSFGQICALRRSALDGAMADEQTKPVVEMVTGGKVIDTKTATCAAVRSVFRTAANLKKSGTKQAVADTGFNGGGLGIDKDRKIKSLADLNKLHVEMYGGVKRKSA